LQGFKGSEHALRVFAKGGGDIEALCPPAGSDDDVELPLGEVSGRYNDAPVLFYFEPSRGIEAWLEEIKVAGSSTGPAASTAVFDFRPDVIISSIEPEIDKLRPPEAEGAETFKRHVIAADEMMRRRLDANLFWLNTTTVDLESHTSSYHGVEVEPRSLRIHRLSLALIELSHELGISIIDVDRVLAETGIRHLNKESRRALVREETFRVLEDYGYFDERPIAVQVGQRSRGGI
jgi:hypothetical protein